MPLEVSPIPFQGQQLPYTPKYDPQAIEGSPLSSGRSAYSHAPSGSVLGNGPVAVAASAIIPPTSGGIAGPHHAIPALPEAGYTAPTIRPVSSSLGLDLGPRVPIPSHGWQDLRQPTYSYASSAYSQDDRQFAPAYSIRQGRARSASASEVFGPVATSRSLPFSQRAPPTVIGISGGSGQSALVPPPHEGVIAPASYRQRRDHRNHSGRTSGEHNPIQQHHHHEHTHQMQSRRPHDQHGSQHDREEEWERMSDASYYARPRPAHRRSYSASSRSSSSSLAPQGDEPRPGRAASLTDHYRTGHAKTLGSGSPLHPQAQSPFHGFNHAHLNLHSPTSPSPLARSPSGGHLRIPKSPLSPIAAERPSTQGKDLRDHASGGQGHDSHTHTQGHGVPPPQASPYRLLVPLDLGQAAQEPERDEYKHAQNKHVERSRSMRRSASYRRFASEQEPSPERSKSHRNEHPEKEQEDNQVPRPRQHRHPSRKSMVEHRGYLSDDETRYSSRHSDHEHDHHHHDRQSDAGSEGDTAHHHHREHSGSIKRQSSNAKQPHRHRATSHSHILSTRPHFMHNRSPPNQPRHLGPHDPHGQLSPNMADLQIAPQRRRRAVSMHSQPQYSGGLRAYDEPQFGGRGMGSQFQPPYQAPSVVGHNGPPGSEVYDDGASIAGSGLTFLDGSVDGRVSQYGLPKYSHMPKPDYRRFCVQRGNADVFLD